jgi:glycogen debranching enzyme
VSDVKVRWAPYPSIPPIVAHANAIYRHHPLWYHNFQYAEEQARGLDHIEDLASPGVFEWDLARGEAVLILAPEVAWAPDVIVATGPASARRTGGLPDFVASRSAAAGSVDLPAVAESIRAERRTRARALPSQLDRAADAYLVRRGEGAAIIAGYPWFAESGRDTFIALRGLCLATGRLEDARRILVEWAGAVSAGMLPDRFAEPGDALEFNTVDTSLWFAIAVHDYLRTAAGARRRVPAADRARLIAAVKTIVAGYVEGTRFGIRMDSDGLLSAGEPGASLTWMAAKTADGDATPTRTGKPVEVEALWLNALRIAGEFSPEWADAYERGRMAFEARFWNEASGSLFDVADVDHIPGTVDATFRPNQIFAVGGLPYAVLSGDKARRVVDAVEAKLLTPLGLRSLEAGNPGTVWPWLLGAFVEAWVRVRGNTPEAKEGARERFLAPLLAHMDAAGLGHISEIADAEPPHTPRGCPFQAWSVGEVLRIDRVILA